MTLKRWKKISETIRDRNPYWTYKVDEYKIPNGKVHPYYYVHTAGSAFIIPMDADDRIYMVRQYRYLNDRFSLEFPGGGIPAGARPEEIARKELIEETGFSGTLEKIGEFNPFNGVTDEITHVFIARELTPSSVFGKDETEEFELVKLSVDQLEAAIHENEIYDGMTLAAWMLVRSKLK